LIELLDARENHERGTHNWSAIERLTASIPCSIRDRSMRIRRYERDVTVEKRLVTTILFFLFLPFYQRKERAKLLYVQINRAIDHTRTYMYIFMSNEIDWTLFNQSEIRHDLSNELDE
jgi:hypothetical protein